MCGKSKADAKTNEYSELRATSNQKSIVVAYMCLSQLVVSQVYAVTCQTELDSTHTTYESWQVENFLLNMSK